MFVGFWWCGLRFGLGWCKFSSCCRSRLAGLVDWCGCGCVWWFENSIVCTVLLHHMAFVGCVVVFDCQSDARPCGTRGGLMGVGVFV